MNHRIVTSMLAGRGLAALVIGLALVPGAMPAAAAGPEVPISGDVVAVTVRSGVPAAPSQPRAWPTGRDGAAVIAWDRPLGGGSPITGYRVRLVGSATTKAVGSRALQVVWTGLKDGSAHRFRVRAVNANGSGPWSPASISVVPFGKPLAPTVSSTAGYMSVGFDLKRPAANGRPIVRLEYDTGSGWTTYDGGFSLNTAQGGNKRCIDVRTVAEGRTPASAVQHSAVARGCGRARPRRVVISFVAKASSAACLPKCFWVNIDVAGFKRNSTQSDYLTWNGSDYCGGAAGCVNPKSFSVGADGRGGIHDYYWISSTLGGTVEASVDGISDSRAVP